MNAMEKLEKEHEEMRKALEEIANMDEVDGGPTQEMIIARFALLKLKG